MENNVENTSTQENQNKEQVTPKTYTIEELKAIDTIMNKRSEGVAAGVAKSQTSTKEEADALLEAYKNYKKNESKKVETSLADITSQLEKANMKVKELELTNSVIMAAQDSGLDNKTIQLFMKSFDSKTAYDEKGNVVVDKIKDGLTQFLEDFPGLKPTKVENTPHIKVGAQQQAEENVETIQDKINKAMGIRPKK